MSLADQLLIGWWVFVPVVSIALFLRFRRHGGTKWLQYPNISRRGRALVIALLLILPASFFIVMWMSHETRLYVLTLQLFLIIFCASLVSLAVAAALAKSSKSIGLKTAMFFMAVTGTISAAFFIIIMIQDLFYPWRVVEGTLESRYSFGERWSISYWIKIDGRPYKTTNEVYNALKIGNRVRAEMGTGSKTIFRVQPIPVTTR
jgi:hypothetical protein